MANHIHLLIKPDDASQLPKLMHWEARYYTTPIAPEDHQRALNTLRYIHANPKAAGVRKGFYGPYSNYGHYIPGRCATQARASAVPAGPTAAHGCRAAASSAPALQFVVGQGLKERLIHASFQEAKLAAGAGIERHQLGDGLAMAGQHDALTGGDPGQKGRQVSLRLLNIDAAWGGGSRWGGP